MPLTHEQQLARFGMTTAEAHALRDRVMSSLDAKAVANARAAWSAMAVETRASKQHPEVIRFVLLRTLDEGKSLAEAVETARSFAQLEN